MQKEEDPKILGVEWIFLLSFSHLVITVTDIVFLD